MMKLTEKEAQEARERALAYEANMAVEGLQIHPDDRAFVDQLDADRTGYEEAIKIAVSRFRDLGVIPKDTDDQPLAAE